MITGVHIEIVNQNVEEAYTFLRDKLGLPNFDAGGSFLIFTPTEIEMAVSSSGDLPHQVWFFCDNIDATIDELEGRGVQCVKPIREESWGRVSEIKLPNGTAVGLYERKYSRGKPIASPA